MTRRIRMTIEYDGAPFAGWQVQARGRSVQGELEAALGKLTDRSVKVRGAGRTDAGVHSLGMVAHFDFDRAIPAERLPRALAPHLPPEISILEAVEVAPDFDARRDALLRWYRYQVQLGRTWHPLGPHAWRIGAPLDLEKMEKALERLEGRHDFSGFRSSQCTASRTRLTMEEASLTRTGDVAAIDFKCRSFLQRMVRLMVGATAMVGMGRLTLGEFRKILSTGERPQNVRSAPPEGLCLMKIAYTPEERENILTDCPLPPSF